MMLLSYLQVICSTIIAATFQTAECKSDPFPVVASVAHWDCSQIVFEQCLWSEMTMQEALSSFWLHWHISSATPTAVFYSAICGLSRKMCVHLCWLSHACSEPLCSPWLLPPLMEIPILGLKPSDLWKYYWLCGFGVFRLMFTITSYQVMKVLHI